LPEGTYLELSVRSSTPLKYWLILANGVGVIDRDYYNNESNEGEIFLQLINLSPFPIKIQKGDLIGQAIVKPYLTLEGDCASGVRTGGFGSTSTQSESSIEDSLRRMIT
jgi:dUTP pyrophosphatase